MRQMKDQVISEILKFGGKNVSKNSKMGDKILANLPKSNTLISMKNGWRITTKITIINNNHNEINDNNNNKYR